MVSKRLTYWLVQCIGWGGLFSLSLINKPITADAVLKVVSLGFIGIVLSHGIRFLVLKIKAFNHHFIWQTLLIIGNATLAAFVFSTLQHLVFLYAFEASNTFFDALSLVNIGAYFLIWQIIYFTYVLREKSRQEMLNNLYLEALNKEAELKNLRNQINPHFMFNALNSIRALIDEDRTEARRAVNLLSNVMRSILLSEKHKLIPLGDELKLVKDFLDLEKIRFEERLNIHFDIDATAKDISIPPLLLQTLVENAIKHGVANRTQNSTINISAKQHKDTLVLIVENDVSTKKTKADKSTHTGLNNLKKRLQLMYKNEAKFLLEINEKAKATIQIPLKNESNNS